MTLKPRQTLAVQVAQYLSDIIIRSELKPGEEIQQKKLAEELGVSRTPVREALRILEREGLVQMIPRHGARVSEMTGSFMESLFDMLGELYALCARRFSENAKDQDRQRLHAALERLKAAARQRDMLGYYQALMECRLAGLQGGKDPLLETILKDLEASTRRVEFEFMSIQGADLEEKVDFLERITKYAAQKGDGEMAAETVRAFFRHEKEHVLENVRDKESGTKVHLNQQ